MSGHFARQVILVKTETTEGTYNDPTSGGQALAVDGWTFGYGGTPKVMRAAVNAARTGTQLPKMGSFYWDLGFNIPLMQWGDTSDADDYPYAPLINASPMTITEGASDGDDLTVRPRWTQPGTFSMCWMHEAGNLYKARGCRCIFEKITSADVSDVPQIAVKIVGLYEATPAAGAVDFATLAYSTLEEVSAGGAGEAATLSLGTTGHVGLAQWEFSTGQSITAARKDQGSTWGYLPALVSHSDYPKLSLTLEEVIEADFAIWARATANTAAAASLTLPGAGSDTFAIEMPGAVIDLPKLENGDDLAKYALEVIGGESSQRTYGFTFS